MSDIKPLEEYEKFSEIIDLKREEFEQSLNISNMNVGMLESLRKMLSLQHESMATIIRDLSDLINQEDTSEADKQQAKDTIESMYLIMFSMEYKATLIYSKVKKLTGQSQ